MERSEVSLEGSVVRAGLWIRAQIVPESEMLSLLSGTCGAKVYVMGTRPGCRPLEEGVDDIEGPEVHVGVAESTHVFVERVSLFQRGDGHLNVDDWFRIEPGNGRGPYVTHPKSCRCELLADSRLFFRELAGPPGVVGNNFDHGRRSIELHCNSQMA
jgi:hypothetical protein